MGYRTFLENTLPLYKKKGLYKELTPNWDDSEEFRRSRWSAKYTGPYTGDVTTKGGGEKGPLLEGFRHGEWLIDPSRCIEKLPPEISWGPHYKSIVTASFESPDHNPLQARGYGLMKYKLGRIEGLQNLFFKNGVKAIEFTIINDKRHGELIWYNEDGSLYGKRSYHMSFRHGEEIYYNQDGSVSKKNTWDMGRKLFEVEVVHKNERGVDERDDAFERMSDGRFFFNGTPYTGKGYNLFDNGNKAAEFFFNEGIMVGKFTLWHENGKQKSESLYIGGQMDINAPSKFWNSKGEPVDSIEEAEQ